LPLGELNRRDRLRDARADLHRFVGNGRSEGLDRQGKRDPLRLVNDDARGLGSGLSRRVERGRDGGGQEEYGDDRPAGQ
jgi:hypothetical protein